MGRGRGRGGGATTKNASGAHDIGPTYVSADRDDSAAGRVPEMLVCPMLRVLQRKEAGGKRREGGRGKTGERNRFQGCACYALC